MEQAEGYSDQQKESFKRQFNLKRGRQRLVNVFICIGCLFLVFNEKAHKTIWFFPLAILLVFGGLAFWYFDWRCPACKRILWGAETTLLFPVSLTRCPSCHVSFK